LLSFQLNDEIGRRMLCDQPNRQEYNELIEVVHTSRSLPRS